MMAAYITQAKRFLEKHDMKRNAFLVLGLGAVAALAMPPIGCWPLLLVVFPLLWILLHTCWTTKQVFVLMWLFAFGYFTAGLYWIAAALFVDIAHNWWVLPFAVMGLPALMSFYPAVAAALWHRLAWHSGPARVLLLVALLSIAEAARGVVFTGFPWNLWGYAWMDVLPVMQSVAWWGIYGLTLLTLLVSFLPVLYWQQSNRTSSRAMAGAVLLLMCLITAWGQGRLMNHFNAAPQQVHVRIVQPNIAQEAKWEPEQRIAHTKKLWDLSLRNPEFAPHVIVWPETAVTLISTADVRAWEAALQQKLPGKALLATGVLDVGWDDIQDQPTFFNRIGIYQADGNRIGAYDKSHLVPFGEYLPYQDYWPVRPVAFQAGRFSAGIGAQTLHLSDLPPFSPLICYEVLFPTEIVSDKKRPAWLLNVTNDAWYGRTSGPYQHLAIARTRAIEQGLPLVRAANTGISAMIDPMGRLVDLLPLEETGVIDAALPPALPPTVYASLGQLPFALMCLVILALAGIWQRGHLRRVPHV